MSDRVWDRFLTERDKQAMSFAGYGAPLGVGERPALLIVDMSYGFIGESRLPLLESIRASGNSCGEEGWEAIACVQRLIAGARAKRIPIVYTTGQFRADGWDYGVEALKNARATEVEPSTKRKFHADTIVEEIAPQPQDIVILKQKPSAFHGTSLQDLLMLLKVDSLFVTGATTSGCVRASVVDAFSRNYRVSVVEEGCCDRSQASHAISLFDIDSKYGDVISEKSCLEHICQLPEALFSLPGVSR